MTCELKVNYDQIENEMTGKPANLDGFFVANKSKREIQRFKFATLKSFLLMTDENRTVNADLTFKDSKKAKFGDSGQLQIYYDSTKPIIHNTENGGSLEIILDKTDGNPLTMMKLDAGTDTPTLAIQNTVIGYTGGPTGMKFDTLDRATFTQSTFFNNDIRVYGNILAESNIKVDGYLNDTGESVKGMWFSLGNSILEQNLTVKGTSTLQGTLYANGGATIQGTVNITGATSFLQNVRFYDKWLTNNGSNGNGMQIYSSGQVYFHNGISVNNFVQISGQLSATEVWIDGNIFAMAEIVANDHIQGKYLVIEENYGTPSTTTGKWQIYVEGSALRVKLGNGTVKTVQFTT